jgi:transposase
MAKYKRYDYKQSLMIPVSLEEQLMPGTLEFAIHTLVEKRMDMSVFDSNYQNDETGRSAYDPKILLKIVLLGYSRGLTSSRQIERACRENVLFMAMSCNQRPDHSTIAPFVSSMEDQIKLLFRDILLVCDQEGLLGGSFFAIDGCKMSSNASKEWSGKISDLQKRKEKIESKLTALVEGHIEIDKEEQAVKEKMSASREKQIKRLEQQAAKVEKWLK